MLCVECVFVRIVYLFFSNAEFFLLVFDVDILSIYICFFSLFSSLSNEIFCVDVGSWLVHWIWT